MVPIAEVVGMAVLIVVVAGVVDSTVDSLSVADDVRRPGAAAGPAVLTW
jgi:hypothetical protein